jgi:hypothetical protein
MVVDLPWWISLTPVVIALLYICARVFVVVWSLRGTKPRERAEILRAVGELFHRPRGPSEHRDSSPPPKSITAPPDQDDTS